MKFTWPLLLLVLGACAHLPAGRRTELRKDLWNSAHVALRQGSFARADTLFSRIRSEYPATVEGRESLFYLGALRLDPRNPGWDPQPAEARLRQYLAPDSAADGDVGRRPEAEILLELAHQLNLPAQERISALQPEVRTRVVRVPQRIVPFRESQELSGQVGELRQQIQNRDAQIRRLQEELERIRKTLTGRRQ